MSTVRTIFPCDSSGEGLARKDGRVVMEKARLIRILLGAHFAAVPFSLQAQQWYDVCNLN